MSRLDELLAKRQQAADWYAERLAEIRGHRSAAAGRNHHPRELVCVRHPPGTRHRPRRWPTALPSAGIPVRPYFLPIHLQPYMVERFGYQPGDFPVTEDLGERGLALPFSGVMSEEQVDLVCQALREVL